MKRIFTVVFPGRVEVFSESSAGVLDFQNSFHLNKDESDSSSSFVPGPVLPVLSHSDFHEPLEWHPFPLQGAAGRLPILTISSMVPRVYVAMVGESPEGLKRDASIFDSIPTSILGFFLRYPSFRSSLDDGDFLTAAHMLVDSKELAPYHALLRFLAGSAADYPVLWYFLHDQDHGKHAMVESYLVQHRLADAHEYRVLFEFSQQLGLCRNLSEFHGQIVRLMAQRWKAGDFLWTEVTGLTFNVPGIGAYLRIVEDVMTLEIANRLHDRCRADQFEPRILEVLSRLAPLTVERELLNSYDAQAIAVYGTNYNGKRMRIGYVKQDLAHVLCQFGGFNSAQLALLDTDAMEILIRREV